MRHPAIFTVASVVIALMLTITPAFAQYSSPVSVVNTPNVNVANTPNVNVANTPNVKVTNMPPVTVTGMPAVSVNSLPPVTVNAVPPITVSAMPSVSVNSLPAVQFDPTSGPLSVVDKTRTPFQITCWFTISEGQYYASQFDTCGGVSGNYTVPWGQVLVVQHVSVHSQQSGASNIVDVMALPTFDWKQNPVMLNITKVSTAIFGNYVDSSENTLFFCDYTLYATIQRDAPTGSANGSITFSGYLMPKP